MDELLKHIVIMQYPVVLAIAVLCFQATNTFRTAAFRYVAFGWLFNLGYLLAQNYPTLIITPANRLLELQLGDMKKLMVFASSAAFWMAARSYPKLRSPLLLRSRGLETPIFLFVLSLVFVEVTSRVLHTSRYPEFLIPAFPDVVVDVIAIYTLALFFGEFSSNHSPDKGRKDRTLRNGTILYAAIQPLYFFTGDNSSQLATAIAPLGFFLGLVSKSLIALGLVRLFADATVKAREEKARMYETRRTVERITHELGTPISESIAHLDILRRETRIRGLIHQSLEKLDNAFQRIEAIMDASKDFHLLSKYLVTGLEGARRAYEKEAVSINKLVQTALMAVKETRDENAKFHISYSGRCGVECVQHELVQVFINLFRNAYDAFNEGRGTIKVKTQNIERSDSEFGGELVRVTLQDDGEGISPNVASRVFEDGFTTRRGPGRGFGLTVAKKMVEKNGGILMLEAVLSSDKKRIVGTRATVDLPRSV